ncbi:hypothetical protein EVAR_99258_1 [Eumeta japonica]|uniref:Uncharacterized protein n=1 Tax=Eumeta variegata TaxID=151549 RepID=A0A4C1TEE9_EUMVA|nr:hypothetical protein EVAR_99258_1 [Eumeta japonica]
MPRIKSQSTSARASPSRTRIESAMTQTPTAYTRNASRRAPSATRARAGGRACLGFACIGENSSFVTCHTPGSVFSILLLLC